MYTKNEQLDQAENLVDLKEVEAAIVLKFDELNATHKQAQGEVKELGDAHTETVSKLEALNKDYSELYDRVQSIEQKGIKAIENSAGFDIGAEFAAFEGVESMRNGKQQSARMELKTAIINATGASQPLVAADRLGGIATTPNRVLRIRDILPSSSTSSNLVEFTRENAFTNNAGPTVAGSPEAFENVTKPESAITFTLASEPVVTLAHWIPASKQVMGDSADLAAHINNRLLYGLKLKEETQLLLGSAANGELNGLITLGTAFTVGSPTETNEVDIIRKAIKQAHVGEYFPDFCVLNPSDWYDIEIRKVGTSDDRYVVGNPRDMGVPVLWGLPIVVSNSITAGTFLIGSSMACAIKDREQSSIEISREDGTNFVKNMVTVLAEERLALIAFRTEAFITGSL